MLPSPRRRSAPREVDAHGRIPRCRCPVSTWVEVDLDRFAANLAAVRGVDGARRGDPPGRQGRCLRSRRGRDGGGGRARGVRAPRRRHAARGHPASPGRLPAPDRRAVAAASERDRRGDRARPEPTVVRSRVRARAVRGGRAAGARRALPRRGRHRHGPNRRARRGGRGVPRRAVRAAGDPPREPLHALSRRRRRGPRRSRTSRSRASARCSTGSRRAACGRRACTPRTAPARCNVPDGAIRLAARRACSPTDTCRRHARRTLPLQPVMSFKSRLVQVRDLPAGTPISYARTFIDATRVAASASCRWATGTATRGCSRTAARCWCAARACRSWAASPWTSRWST